MKHVNANVDWMQFFVIINKVGIKINANASVKNKFIKVYAIKTLFGILVIVNVNVINHVILVSIQIIKIVNVKKGW